jgi:hypothetical protein
MTLVKKFKQMLFGEPKKQVILYPQDSDDKATAGNEDEPKNRLIFYPQNSDGKVTAVKEDAGFERSTKRKFPPWVYGPNPPGSGFVGQRSHQEELKLEESERKRRLANAGRCEWYETR